MSFTPTPTEGDDIIIQAEGDLVQGGPGNDTLNGGIGMSTLVGGTGDDLYGLITHEHAVIELPGEGYDTVQYRDDFYTGALVQPLNVELMVLVGRFNAMTGEGNEQDNHIAGNNTGNDTIYGLAGNDTIEGDRAYYFGSNSFSSWTGNDVLYGGDGNDLLYGDRNSPGGGDGNDTLYGEAGNDTLWGGDGNDELHGGDGNDLLGYGDLLAGGAGDDTYLLTRYVGVGTVVEAAASGETNVIRVEGLVPSQVALTREGNDLVLSAIGYQFTSLRVPDWFGAAVPPVARVEFESGTVWDTAMLATAQPPVPDADLFVTGTEEFDRLQGGAGDDTIDGLGGDDQIDALGGNDSVLGGTGHDVLLGGDGDDWLDGGADPDYLGGGAGNDTLVGDAGPDNVEGGPGDDIYDLGASINDIILLGPTGHDVVRALPVSFDEYVDGTRLSAWAYWVHTPGQVPQGLKPEEVVFSRVGDDLRMDIPAAASSVTVEGYFAQAASGQFPQLSIEFEGLTWRNAEIQAAVVATDPGPGPGAAEGTDGPDTLAGSEDADVILGRAGNDALQGGDGNDFLNGETGADTLTGGTGDDQLIVDDAGDVVVERPGEGVDTVQSYIDHRLPRQVENLTLIGNIARVGTGNANANVLAGNDVANDLFGRAGNDLLMGNGGNDFLDGGPGADSMRGGAGDDTVVVDDPADVIGEDAGDGIDTVQSYIDFTLPDTFENLTLIGRWAQRATGNGLGNVIIGNAADNVIDGVAGPDTLEGGRGDDVFLLHGGTEQVDGGQGADTLRFGPDLAGLVLTGKAGVSLRSIEAIDMTNGSVSALTMTTADVAALGLDRPLRVAGEAGDALNLDAGWSAAGRQGGYDRYVNGDALILVGIDVAVAVGVVA